MHSLISRILTPVLFFGLSTHCTWDGTPAKDTLVVALSSHTKTLDPRFATDANGQRIADLLFSALVKLDDDLSLKGDMALNWTYHKRTYQFQLRPHLYFHDGQAVTVDDLLFSFSEYQKPSSPFWGQFSMIKSVSANYTSAKGGELRVELKEYSASFLQDLSLLKILPKHLAKQSGFSQSPTGTGPYQLQSMDSNQIHLAMFPQYFGPLAKSKKLHFKVIHDGSTRFYKVYKGEIDIVQSDIPVAKIQFFKKNPEFQVVVRPSLSTTYLLFNLRKYPMQEVRFRQALRDSIDVDTFIQHKFEGYADKATSLLPSSHPDFHSQLSWTPMSEETIRKAFELNKEKPLVLKTSNNFDAMENGRILVNQLENKGLAIEQQSFEWGTYYEDIKQGHFDMALMKWVGITDPDLYRISLHSSMTPPGRNRGFYQNPKFDQLITQVQREESPQQRRKILFQIQEMMLDELPIIPLWHEKQVAIINRRVKNYILPLNGDFSGLLLATKEF
jgi:peptide/nickel transport system substrate-binding protein